MLKQNIELRKNQKPPKMLPSDLLRSAVVFSISAMDSYFTDRFCELLVPYLKKQSPGSSLVTLLGNAGLDAEQALIMAQMKRPFSRVRTLVRAHLDSVVTQNFAKINELFICFGLANLCEDAQALRGRKSLLRSIEILIKRRHKIVHEGDLNYHGRLNRLNLNTTSRRIRDLMNFVDSVEDLIFRSVKL